MRDLLTDRKTVIEPPAYLAFLLRDRLGGTVRGEGLQLAFQRAQEVRSALPPAPSPGPAEQGAAVPQPGTTPPTPRQ